MPSGAVAIVVCNRFVLAIVQLTTYGKSTRHRAALQTTQRPVNICFTADELAGSAEFL